MPQPIALVAADTHLDHLIWRNRPEIAGDSFFGFSQAVGASVKRGLPFIGAGDLSEELPADTPDSLTIQVMRQQIARLKKAKIPLHYVNGQHDKVSRSGVSLIEACGGPPPADEQLINIGGRNFYFLSWRPEKQANEALQAVPKDADVVIMHQPCQELMGGNYEVRLSAVPHAKLVISGDLHKYKQVQVFTDVPRVKKSRAKGEPKLLAVSPGATCVRKINEPTQHYVVVVYDDLSVKRVKLRSRVCLRYGLDDVAAFEEMYQAMPAALEKAEATAVEMRLPPQLMTPFFVVNDSTSLPNVKDRLEEALRGRVHLFYSKTSLGFEADQALSASQAAPDLSLAEMIGQETANRTVADLLVSALESGNPRKFLQQYRKQRIP